MVAELGETQDPQQLVPGKPEAIEENARVLSARSDRANWAGEGLLAIDTGAWEGPAAREFQDKFSFEPRKWFAAADALDSGASALEDYASTLRWAQAQAVEAIQLWNQGQEATQQATARHDSAVAQAAAHNQPATPFTDPGEATRQAARDTLERARAQLKDAGDTAAGILRGETDAAPQKSSWLDDVGHFLGDVGAHIVNDMASFGNALLHHPEDVVSALGGLGLTVASGAGMVGGGLLTATGEGAIVGVPAMGISAAGAVTGVGMMTAAMGDLASHAGGDDRVEPIKTNDGSAGPAPVAQPTPAHGLSDMFTNGPPKASDLDRYAQEQGLDQDTDTQRATQVCRRQRHRPDDDQTGQPPRAGQCRPARRVEKRIRPAHRSGGKPRGQKEPRQPYPHRMGLVTVQNYTDFPDLTQVYLEDSFVLDITEDASSISFELEAVLTPQHPAYHAPQPGEQYCYADADLIIDGATKVHWIERTHHAYTDASGESDLGNIDSMLHTNDHYDIAGDWGQVHVYSRNAPRLVFKDSDDSGELKPVDATP
jgi:hypothetical protein